MKSFFISLFVSFICLQPNFVFAESCGHLFAARPRLLSARAFFSSPVSPAVMKRDGDIVVTEPLMRALSADQVSVLRAYLVLDLQRLSPAQFAAMLKREYGLVAKFGKKFPLGFQDIEVIGSSVEVSRFLGNRYAQKTVLWAGKTRGDRYIQSVMGYFVDSAPSLESQSQGMVMGVAVTRSPFERDLLDREPKQETPAFLEERFPEGFFNQGF
jgi:hypothetical protein